MTIKYLKKSPKTSSTDDKKTREIVQKLLDDLEELNEWPNKVKVMQKNWIGKSYGCEVNFKIEGDIPVNEIR